jgi:hypothetical protein
MRIQIALACVGLTTLLHHVGEAAEVYGECTEPTTFASIPFTASAYDACTFFHDKSLEKFGGCGDEDLPLDGQPNDDPVCDVRGGQCHVAFTEPGEYLEYSFTAPDTHGSDYVFNIVARVASARPRRFRLEIDNGGDYISKTLTTSGKGFRVFEDLMWERVQIPGSGPERIFVHFVDGETNFCSLRIEPTTTYVDKALKIPFDASAQRYITFIEKSPERFGSCGPGFVDSQPTSDSVCKQRGGDCNIGWTESGEQVTYLVVNGSKAAQKNVILRVASLSRGRKMSVELEGYPETVYKFETPGKGYQVYQDFTWSKVNFPAGKSRLIVKFLNTGINMCSLSVK